MILFPAIDLKDGVCVRLEQGDMARATVFNRDPAAQAQTFVAEGFEYLHVVDLDGAFAGRPVNVRAVERILESIPLPVQLGGGCATWARSRRGSKKGSTVSSSAPRRCAIRRSCGRRPAPSPAVSRSASTPATARWRSRAGRRPPSSTALEIAQRFEDAGVAAIIYTDIARDGLLKGLNLDATIALADAVAIPVIASGGLASLEDIRLMLEPRAMRLAGAIAGRALYDGRLNASEALRLIRAARDR